MIRRRTARGIRARAATSGPARGTYCCLHLGMPKTATTSLQQHLFPNHPQIAYLGKFAKTQDKFPTPAVRALNTRLAGAVWPRAAHCRRLFSEWIASPAAAGRVPMWSKEGMTGVRPSRKKAQAKAFRDVLGDCKVLLFVREPLKFIESIYFQNLKGFHAPKPARPGWMSRFGEPPRYVEIEEWLDFMWGLPHRGEIGHLACAETAEIYADVFDREQVRVFVFEQLVEDPDAIVGELCRFIGVDAKEGIELFRGKRENDRWTVAHIERLKRIQESPRQSAIFREGARKTRDEMLGFGSGRSDGTSPKARAEIPAEWKERILEFVRQEHRRLVDEWGLPLEEYGYSL